MGPDVPGENLRFSGALMRFDMMIATNLLEKFANMKRNQRLSVHRAHALSHFNHMEHSCQIEGRPLAGREMMRAMSESGQHWICRDFFKLTIDRQKYPTGPTGPEA
eukprot:7503870-Pyramimonas_sp.AAC.1